MEVIITAPSLDPSQNVSGVSAVVRFIIDNNKACRYVHFEMGKRDAERGGLRRIVSLAKAFREWRRLLREKPESIVHYSFPLSTRSILRDPLFIREAIRQGHRVIVHIHGGLYLTAKTIPFMQRHILKRVFSWDVPFVVLSDLERQLVIERFGAKRVTVLPNCVDVPVDVPVPVPVDVPVNVSVPVDVPVLTLGYIGRIEENKGLEELLAACRQLKEEGLPFRLEIAGKEEREGEFLPRFDELLGSNFRYAGVVCGNAKAEFFRRLDVFVMPSYFEGLPISLLESMSYGVVPVVTPVGSIPTVVEDGKNGLLTAVKEVQPVADAIKRLAEDRRLLMEMGRNARETILTRFSPSNYVEKLNNLYITTST